MIKGVSNCCRFSVLALGSVFVIWLCYVQILYLITRDRFTFIDPLGRPQAIFLLPQVGVPFAFRGLWELRKNGLHAMAVGALAGFALGGWFNVLLLTLPYMGLYPSLPCLLIGSAFSGGGTVEDGPAFFFPVMAGNILLWIGVGCLAAKAADAGRQDVRNQSPPRGQ